MNPIRVIGSTMGPLVYNLGGWLRRSLEFLMSPDSAALAREAFRHMVGFDPVRWILTGIREALARGREQDFIESGVRRFGELRDRYDLGENEVMDAPPFPVLGNPGDRLKQVYEVIRDIGLPGLKHLEQILDSTRRLSGHVRDFVAWLDEKLPGDWSNWVRNLTRYEQESAVWVNRIHQVHDRLQRILDMVDRVIRIGKEVLSPEGFRVPSVELR